MDAKQYGYTVYIVCKMFNSYISFKKKVSPQFRQYSEYFVFVQAKLLKCILQLPEICFKNEYISSTV